MLWTLKDVNAIVILRKVNERHKSKTIEMKHNVMRFFLSGINFICHV